MKAWYQSKTIWIAILAALLGIGVAAQDYLSAHPGVWGAPEWLGLALLVVAGVLAQLRATGSNPLG